MEILQVLKKNTNTNMNIVCGGCSFTRQAKRLGLNGTDTDFLEDELQMWRWPHHIQELHNIGMHEDV